jgi:hypothetical protein
MTRVQNSATVVVRGEGSEAAAMNPGQVRQALALAQAQLADLESSGRGQRFGSGPGVSALEVQQLKDNIRKHKEAELAAVRAKEMLVEAKASRVSGPQLEALQGQVKDKQFQVTNFRDIIMRQKSIHGLWIPASGAYKAKLAEIRDLEVALQMAGA